MIASAMTLGIGGLAAACKPAGNPARTGADIKDFAVDATAANFAVVIGHGRNTADDAAGGDKLRYTNYLSTGYLGKFKVALADAAATKASVISAFQEIAGSMQENSSLFLAYTGEQHNGKFQLADGELSMADLVAQLGGKKFARFYLMNDSVGNAKGQFLTRDQPFSAQLGQIIEFNAFSSAGSKGGAYNGRLSAEFSGVTDKALLIYTQSQRNPTLGSFYNAIVSGTKAAANQPAEWYVSDPKVLNEVIFNPATFPPKSTATLNLASAPAAALPAALDMKVTKADGTQTTLHAAVGSAKTVMFKIATKWCKPCAAMSTRLAANAQLQAKIASGDVAVFEAVAVPKTESDGQDVAAAVVQYGTLLTAANASVAPVAMQHAYGVDSHIAELVSGPLAAMNPAQTTDHCPFLVLLDRSGRVVAGSAQEPTEVAVMKALGIEVAAPTVSNEGAGADHAAGAEQLDGLFKGPAGDTKANEAGDFELK